MIPDGLQLQFFDQVRDADDDDAPEVSKESFRVKAAEKAKFIASNVALGAITGAPGFVFGIGRTVATKAQRSIHDRRAHGMSVTCTITAVRVSGLYQVNQLCCERKMSPWLRVELIMAGLDSGRLQRGRTTTRHHGGDTFTFEKDKHVAILGIPTDDFEAASTSSLLVSVMDEPEFGFFGLFRQCAGSDFTIGIAAVSLAQMFAELEEHESVATDVNLNLFRGDQFQIPAGLLRIRVELATQVSNRIADPSVDR